MKKYILILVVIVSFASLVQSIETDRIINLNLETVVGGVSTFIGLTDTPSSYITNGGECVKVNAGETALEFGACAVGGGGSGKAGDGGYLFNNSATMFFNDTLLNQTIDDLSINSITNIFDQDLNTTSNVIFNSVNVTTNFIAKTYRTTGNDLSFNFYDDGSDIFMNISNSGGDFFIEQDNTKIGLFNNPAAGNNFKVFQVFSKEASEVSEFVVTKAGPSHASYFIRSLALPGNATTSPTPFNCSSYANFIDCDTDLTGPDFFVIDDIELGGTLYVGEGVNATDWTNVTITEDQISDLVHSGGNASFNQTLTDTLYALITWNYNQSTPYDIFNYNMTDGVGTGNLSWNQSLATTLFANIIFGYNMSTPYDIFNYNMTDGTGAGDGTGGWTNDSIQTNTSLNVNVQNGANLSIGGGTQRLDLFYNGTAVLFDTLGNNAIFTDNVTADSFIGDGSLLTGISGGNASFNQTLTDTLYALITWNYNQSTPYDIFNYNMTTGFVEDTQFHYNQSTPYDTFNYNMTDGVGSGNSSWNQSFASSIYPLIIGVNNFTSNNYFGGNIILNDPGDRLIVSGGGSWDSDEFILDSTDIFISTLTSCDADNEKLEIDVFDTLVCGVNLVPQPFTNLAWVNNSNTFTQQNNFTDIVVQEFIQHDGDTGTNIRFTAGQILLQTPVSEAMVITSTQVNFVSDQVDIDVVMNSGNINSIFKVDSGKDQVEIKALNMTSNNITSTDCIVFRSGGKICSGT